MEASAVDLSTDRLETVLEDGEFVLYRSAGGAHATPARSMLVVMPRSDHPRLQSVRMLENEHSLRDELDPAWALRPLALTTLEGRPALVLEDPGGELLLQCAGTPMDVADVLRVGAGVAGALRQLHGRGLIHKDIKPAHVVVHAATGQVWLIGFGIASRLSRERQTPGPPEFLAGTLAYMAPEQTGRMNRSIDSRSDLYSLGVTLYELATGTLPFTATEPMEWVHCHIARLPMPPRERVPALPSPLSAIILKLLAKAPEDRYQTAAGLEADLRRCLGEWESRGRIDEFPLGARDRSDRLLMPEKLYGRQRERQILLDAFDQVVASGTPHLVLVSGYSGIGKSAVVNELHRAIVLPRGIFISGKFDQYKRDVPYATIAQAFQALIRQILSASDAEVDRWREQIREAVGPNGQLIVSLIPELELVLGTQVPVPELPPTEAERRFHLVFRSFLGVFARQQHPLALFLDDLQWLDTATLKLLEDVMTHPDIEYLLLIGAYRDNEVSASHPLVRTVEAIRQAKATVRDIVLAPLSLDDVTDFVTDTLHHDHAAAGPLARLVYQKTLGNPFFAIQFLTALRDECLLAFDAREAIWTWDLDHIRARGFTDNVVDLMIGKLERLPSATQEALKDLACLGNSADITTLSLVRETSEETIHADLWEALRLEFIQRADDAYRFVHDRVHEAAYSLIPASARGAAHLRIGRLLASRTAPAEIDEKIFEIVSQLNRGADLIAAAEERAHVAELNLMAGKRAKMSTAYASAIAYLTAGRALLRDENWDQTYDLIFAIELQTAECEVLTARMTPAEDRLSMLATRARHAPDVAAVARLRLTLYTTLDRSDRGVEVCLEYLQRGGTTWSPHPTVNEVRREYDRIWSQLGDRSIEALIDLPLISDRDALAAVDVLTEMVTPALFTDENLVSLVICRMVNLSLEHGNSDGSCFAYVWLGIIAGPRFGDYQAGFRFGRLGYDLVEQRGLKRFQARTYMCFGNIVMPWTKHIKTGRELVRRAFEAAKGVGDLTFAAYSLVHVNTNFLAAGDPLVDVQHEATVGLEFAEKARFGLVIDILRAQIGLIHSLRGVTTTFGLFDTDQFDEQRFEHHLASNAVLALPECWYWIRKLQARFFAGDYAAALDSSAKARRLLWTSPSLFEVAEYEFYTALARAASCETATGDERREQVAALVGHQRQLAVWAENCPENFENRAALVGAEIARLDGRPLDAEHLYEQAIRSAQANGFIHNEALAHELAARFYVARGFETSARAYLREARYGYLRWGADGKVRQLDELYPRLRQDESAPDSRGTSGAPVEQLELTTVLKVSQAVSGEMILDRLLDKLMRAAIEHAGAERGLLIARRGDALQIQAQATTSGADVTVNLRDSAHAEAALPESLIRYAMRTRDTVILEDAASQNLFSADPYLVQRRARSILCLPLINQGNLIGVLYLENNLAPRVFGPARIAVLKLLASQAAMALENTRLYRDLAKREADIRRLVDANVVGILIYDVDGTILEANDALLRMVGYEREDLVSGRVRWTDLSVTQWRGRDRQENAAEIQRSGRLQPLEWEYIRKDSSRVPVLVGAASFEGENQGVAFVLDLTERRRAEDAQKCAEAELQQARTALAHRQRVSMLGEVAASLAHEIRQPITAVRIDANVCLRALADHRLDLDAARDAASRMIKGATRADEIIKRTTALYKKDTSQRERMGINVMIREMSVLLQQEASASAVAIRTECAGGLPVVMADRIQLQQVFMNLMLNAIDAMKDAGGELTITSQMREGSELLIGVSDTGVGLPADNPERIFESFVTTKPEGTGMGLAITRSIVESHGGRLWATANVGRGATFLFTLPGEAEH